MLLAADPDEHLVHVPLVAGLWPTRLQRIGEDPAEAQAPPAAVEKPASIEEDAAASKSYRPLDMMDTLSGFPKLDPLKKKEADAGKGAPPINLPKPTPEMLNDLFKRVNPIDPREDQSKGEQL